MVTTLLPPVGLGCAALGGLYSDLADREAVDTITTAFASGVRYFDTAPLYGYGSSEHRLGLALAELPAHEVLVSTKVGRVLDGEGGDRSQDGLWANLPEVRPRFDFSRSGVRRSFDESRRRIGRERFDVLLIHDPQDYMDIAIEEAYPAVDELRSEGAARWVGVGTATVDAMLRFLDETRLDCVLLAGRYTLLDHVRGLDEVLPLCEAKGVAVIAGGVFNSGILADPLANPRYQYSDAPAEVLQRVRELSEVCRRHGVSLRDAALQFTAAHPAVTTVLLGSRSAAEVTECLAGLKAQIPEAFWDELKERRLIDPRCPTRRS